MLQEKTLRKKSIMYSENDLLMISALQHLAFCERQCALIHIEQQWAENRFTALGEILHEKVHSEGHEKRKDCITARSLRLVSYKLGLTGQTDVVEFHQCVKSEKGVALPDYDGYWKPYPVEYKKGKPKANNVDKIQLCAQAICLEEQLDVKIGGGALFYGEKRHRQLVEFSSELREETATMAERLHELVVNGKTPSAVYSQKCDHCSLYDICNPKLSGLVSQRNYEKTLFETMG